VLFKYKNSVFVYDTGKSTKEANVQQQQQSWQKKAIYENTLLHSGI
jgi:hypothetical protein